MYFVRDNANSPTKYILLIEQNKAYINNQLKEVVAIYVASIIVIAIMAVVVSALLASNVTKPIEVIRKKAQLIAAGSDIAEITLDDSQRSEYEVVRLVESFNLMIGQIKNNLSEISNEKNKLEAILLHLSDGVLAFNTKGELILANPVAREILKLNEENSFEEIFKKLQIDINMEKVMYLDDWTSTEQSVKFEDLILNMFFASFKNENDDFGGLVCVVHDVTKQVKLEEMRKEFVANVSHELKTPLTSIKTYTETLLDSEMGLDDEETTKFLNVILTESNRMKRLVEDLLQLTRFDYKKVAWNKIYFDLGELTKQICEKHKIQAETKKQNLECYITSNVPMVYADRDGVEQVITNILTNSIKYTGENGNVKVYVGCVHDDAYIKIIDDGIGIPEQDLPRVFERFYRVDKARSREMGGTGLGLPIAKEIIEANGGSIDMKSEVGKGTEVIIKVPIMTEENLKSQ
jgi:two-component system sensor histidine kinase VicK